MIQYQCHLRIDQSDPLELIDDITELRFIRFQEFTTGRHIEEQVLDRKDTPLGTSIRFYIDQVGSGNRELRTQFSSFQTGTQFHMSHCSNRSQRFAAKAHGMKGKEVFGRRYFRSGMPFECHTGICLGHTFPVIDHLDQCTAGILYIHLDMTGTSVDRVLNQFLYNGSRPLNDFTGRYLIGYTIW